MNKTSVVALAVLTAGAASAQDAAKRDPWDPEARVPAVEYRSVFSDYQPYQDPPAAIWRESNEVVKALGGHAGHIPKPGGSAKDAPTPPPKPSAAPAGTPMTGGYQGHRP